MCVCVCAHACVMCVCDLLIDPQLRPAAVVVVLKLRPRLESDLIKSVAASRGCSAEERAPPACPLARLPAQRGGGGASTDCSQPAEASPHLP